MRSLVLLPSLTGGREPDGRVRVTGKWLSGMHAYVDRWPGPVEVWMEEGADPSRNLDDVTLDPKALPFTLRMADHTTLTADDFKDASVVFGGLGYRQNDIHAHCERAGVPFVTTSEYTLRTRAQIIDANTNNPLLRIRRRAWEYGQEAANQRAVRSAAGVQCNGTPTYDVYRELNANALLYFDTRTQTEDLLTLDELDGRLAKKRPLALVFSGRLNRMKGAHLLPGIADALRRRGVDFTLDICGDGEVAGEMRDELRSRGLEDVVRMRGVLDFHTELIPFTKSCDLFVCPHLQGDPSCTYLETFASGVPIAGFDNEAFDGLFNRVPAGWRAPLGDVDALAERVERAARSRQSLASRSRAALAFAAAHTAERTFERRVEHLISLARP